jgi:DNA-binding Lrp family transcriptional regulator
MSGLDPLQRTFINRFQGGFPLVERPFHGVAAELGTTETTLIQSIRRLCDEGWLSRFGPLFDAERLGGCFTLAALAVPEADFARVAEQVNALDEVAHNYRREHPLNMWFVLATEGSAARDDAIRAIERETGLPVHDFPKLESFHLGFKLHLDAEGAVGIRRVEPRPFAPARPPDSLDRALVASTQAGLPLVPEPYAAIAEAIGTDQPTLLARLAELLASGAIRRIGAVPNHYKLGLRGNGMTVWDVPDDRVEQVGHRLGAREEVTHCYRRPRHPPLWPYNLFAMVHGRGREEVEAHMARLVEEIGADSRAHATLFSTVVLKKTGLRWAG